MRKNSVSAYAMDKAINYSTSYPPVTDQLLAEITRRVLTVGKPRKIVLFGSRARGNYRPDSDIDILIVEESDQLRDCNKHVYDSALKGVFPEQTVLVYSLRDIEQWRRVPNSLTSQALTEGRTLYDNPSAPPVDITVADGACLVAEDIEHRNQFDLARVWFLRADADLDACHRLIGHESSHAVACFLAQQAIEKYLKGFLALHLVPFKKTHDLEGLLTDCDALHEMPELHQLNLKELTGYAIDGRYNLDFWPAFKTADAAFTQAKVVREVVLSHVPQEAKPETK